MTVQDIRQVTTKNWQHKLGSIGEIVTEIEDIEQCFDTIFKTRKGSVVLNPNLGWDMLKYLAKPLNNKLTAKMRVELMRELNLQEPRANVKNILFDTTNFAEGHLSVTIQYTPVHTSVILNKETVI